MDFSETGGESMVNKADVAAEVAARLADADPDARQYVDAVFDIIMGHVAAGERVQILGFGTFDAVARAARIGRNPRTGAAIQVPAGITPRFHAGQTFRSQVSDGSQAAAPVEVPAEQDAVKPAKAKKAKGAQKKPAKAAADKPVEEAVQKPAKAAKKSTKAAAAKAAEATKANKPAEAVKESTKTAAKPAKAAADKSAKAAKPGKKSTKVAAKEVAAAVKEKPAKAAKSAKKSAKAGKK
ncbi:DNA-binding protein HU-beta [Catenulispora sp. MAP12-49]|uniref:HU family DNA-binding protein n=1 Tax=Catenulispora sp. MAP12-49 TaxID=3156302 RepID=UPI0035131E09